MKKNRKEPVFNIEMEHHLRNIVMKRGHLIRAQRTRTMFVLNKVGRRSWLEARLIPNRGEEPISNWDKAHELAGKINRELHTSVYVEPASKHGRYNALVTDGTLSEPAAESKEDADFMPAPPVPSPAPAMRSPGGFVTGVGSGVSSMFSLGGGNTPGLQGQAFDPMAHQKAMLPPELREVLGEKPGEKNQAQVKCPILYDLAGWDELPLQLRNMFETEAAQLLHGGLKREPDASPLPENLSKLDMLKLQPNISRRLKHFLEAASQA